MGVGPYYADERITIYHGDCRDVLPTLGEGLAIVSDPPYGMKWDTDTSRFSGGAYGPARGKKKPKVQGDSEPFDPSTFITYPRCVMFGYNHFAPRVPAGTLLVWAKKTPNL